MRIRNEQAVMDHTLGNEHKQIIGFYTVFSKATREMFIFRGGFGHFWLNV